MADPPRKEVPASSFATRLAKLRKFASHLPLEMVEHSLERLAKEALPDSGPEKLEEYKWRLREQFNQDKECLDRERERSDRAVERQLQILKESGASPTGPGVGKPEQTGSRGDTNAAREAAATAANSGRRAQRHAAEPNTQPMGGSKRLEASITSPIAVRRMEDYLKSKGMGLTEFAGKSCTTDRTLRKFRQTGKVRRGIFDAIAKAMGTTREALLKPE